MANNTDDKVFDDVFFFGAGFSRAVKKEYPLLDDLSKEILKEDNLKNTKLLKITLKKHNLKNKKLLLLQAISKKHKFENEELLVELLEDVFKEYDTGNRELLDELFKKYSLKKYETIYKEYNNNQDKKERCNIESLLTFLSSPLPFKDDITRLEHEAEYKEALKAITKYFKKLDDDLKSSIRNKTYQFADYAKNIAEYIKKKHCPCITLNYDILLERMIQSTYQKDSDFDMFNVYRMPIIRIKHRTLIESSDKDGDKYKQPFEIIKLHGSINWYYNNIKQDDTIYYVPRELYTTPAKREDTRKEIKLLNTLTSDLTPFIIPPVLDKQSQYHHSVISFLWRRAFDFIKNAKNIYIVGFSFPATDLAIKFLFQNALAQNTNDYKIYLVNMGDKETRKRYKEIFGNKCNVTRFNKSKNNNEDNGNVKLLGEYLSKFI